MSEGSPTGIRWPHAVMGALLLLVGIDVGMRIASRPSAAPPSPVAAAPQNPAANAPAGNVVAAPAGTTKIIVVHDTPGSGGDRDEEGAPPAPPPPDPHKEAAERMIAEWAKAPDAGPIYEIRSDEPEVLPLDGKAAELVRSAEAASSAGNKDEAADLLKQAERAATDPRHQEDLRIRRLWLLYDAKKYGEVRQLAEQIGQHPVRAESRRMASELLSKLDAKAGK